MLIVELQSGDFDKAEGFVKIGMVARAIARAKGVNNLQDSERKIFPRINEAVQSGKLRPLDSETLRPLSISDYGTGIVPFAELVEWGQAAKLFDFRREQYTIMHVDGESTMNPAAHEEYQRALESRRARGRYSLDEAAQYVANNSNANAKSIYTKLEKSAETGELTIHWPGSDEVYKPKPRDPLSMLRMRGFGVRGVEEAYCNELNDWLRKYEPRLDCKFHIPDAPAAKLEAAQTAKPEAVPVITHAQVIQNKLRRNILDPAIDKAIKQAGNMELADVYLKLKDLALDSESPFTGALEGDALCYTDNENKPAKLTKEALGKRLKRR